MQATRPVQDQLGMPFDEKRDQYRAALYLPSPLYVLYVQATAYADACGKWLLQRQLYDYTALVSEWVSEWIYVAHYSGFPVVLKSAEI